MIANKEKVCLNFTINNPINKINNHNYQLITTRFKIFNNYNKFNKITSKIFHMIILKIYNK